MTNQWDRFASTATRHLDALGFDNNVELYDATESFTQGEGYDITHPGSPTETINGETEPISAQSDTDRGGTTREGDLLVHVPNDISTDVDDSGESGEAHTRVEVDGTSETYEVLVVEQQFDGIQTLVCAEVDT